MDAKNKRLIGILLTPILLLLVPLIAMQFTKEIYWKLSDFVRNIISILPRPIKKVFCLLIAALIYFPLSRLALFIELFGFNVSNFLLSDYRNKPFYQMRNDALDRFGTRLEQRFSRQKIEDMLLESGFQDISFSEEMPFWTSISYKS